MRFPLIVANCWVAGMVLLVSAFTPLSYETAGESVSGSYLGLDPAVRRLLAVILP